ncbi:conserved protein [Tepidicaulis marinus]|uniref:Conserved protein n=1 Tax=Tepidicaulis marinus TaxID=1333998 RepID=A0A081BC01_9HYPH|nr:hypothetical protein [Tepidicaulis marinus]GAK45569.1 conserved protein [Tepidicaulis marinus]
MNRIDAKRAPHRFGPLLAGLFGCALLFWQDPVSAEPSEQALALYHEGDFLSAANKAEKSETASALAFAARALLTEAELRTPYGERGPLFDRAMELARQSLRLDAAMIEARLQLVAALGFKSRAMEGLEAHFSGYPEEARAHLDYVLEEDPGNALAHAMLGSWNLIIVRKGGAFGAAVYGADVETGIRHYETALTLAPGNALIAYQYALQCAALGTPDKLRRAEELLEGILAREADSAVEEIVTGRAGMLKAALESGSERVLEPILAAHLGKAAMPKKDAVPAAGRAPAERVRKNFSKDAIGAPR